MSRFQLIDTVTGEIIRQSANPRNFTPPPRVKRRAPSSYQIERDIKFFALVLVGLSLAATLLI